MLEFQAAYSTRCVTTGEVLPAKSVLPANAAVIEELPTGSFDVVNVAFPPLSGAVPRTDDPFLNVTVPVGKPALEVTVAVNVTAYRKVDGLFDDATEVEVEAALTVCVSADDVLAAKVVLSA